MSLNDKLLNQQLKKVVAAKNRAAIQEKYAPDYIDIKGIRFYKATVAHVWLLARVQVMPAISTLDHGAVVVYSLAHDQDAVRNKIMTEVCEGSVITKAYEFLIDNELEPEDLSKALELSDDILMPAGSEKKTFLNSTIIGGRESSTP